jgi:PAS domain-containing protein
VVHRTTNAQVAEKIRTETDYFARNAERMHYPKSRRQHFVQREQKCTEEELRQRAAQYRTVIKNIPEIVWTADEHGIFC